MEIGTEKIIEAYSGASTETVGVLNRMLGTDVPAVGFVKTFDEAVESLGSDHPVVRRYRRKGMDGDTEAEAFERLRVVTAAVNRFLTSILPPPPSRFIRRYAPAGESSVVPRVLVLLIQGGGGHGTCGRGGCVRDHNGRKYNGGNRQTGQAVLVRGRSGREGRKGIFGRHVFTVACIPVKGGCHTFGKLFQRTLVQIHREG